MNQFADFTFKTLLPSLLGALPLTVYMLVLSLFFSLFLGTGLAYARLRKNAVAKALSSAYIAFIRGTPELAQLFLVYFGLPQLLSKVGIDTTNWSPTAFAIITFTLNVSAYLSEVMRSAYLSVGAGQREAAYSVGMSSFQSFRRVIFPQAFGVALPNLGNTVIILFKDTSLAFTIGVLDVMGQGKIISSRDFGASQLEIYVVIAILYWLVCIVLERGSRVLEKLYKKGTKAMA